MNTFIPNFDDEANEGRKIAFICSKGNLDMAYPGLILANAALGEGIEVHVFFTFWGFDMIIKSRQTTCSSALPAMLRCISPSATCTCHSRWLHCQA